MDGDILIYFEVEGSEQTHMGASIQPHMMVMLTPEPLLSYRAPRKPP